MKLFVFVLMILGSAQSFAYGGDHVLECVGQPWERVWVSLDAESMSDESPNFRVLGAGVNYNYSSTISMACDTNYYSKDGSETISCAGYYYNDDLTVIKVYPEGEKIFAEWTTSKSYGQIDFKTECQLRAL